MIHENQVDDKFIVNLKSLKLTLCLNVNISKVRNTKTSG
jgi:hypothetical protein